MKNLHHLTQNAMPYFIKKGLKMDYKKGQLFVRPEDTAQGIYYLSSGQTMVFATKKDGSQQIIGIWEKGAIFGKVGSVIDQRYTSISIQALSNCVVYRLDCKQFQTLLESDTAFFTAYMNQVAYNNVFILNQILTLGEKNIYVRVISELLLLADYYGDLDQKSCTLRVVLTQGQLAELLCITREYVSKMLKRMKLNKMILVDKDGRITIPNMIKLKEALEQF